MDTILLLIAIAAAVYVLIEVAVLWYNMIKYNRLD